MKYENLDKVNDIANVINKSEAILNELKKDRLVCVIKRNERDVLMIKTSNEEDDIYKKYLCKMVEEIKDDLNKEISKLKKSLETL